MQNARNIFLGFMVVAVVVVAAVVAVVLISLENVDCFSVLFLADYLPTKTVNMCLRLNDEEKG